MEKFEWGTPDVETIENVCKTRFKWDEDRINNTLDPLKKVKIISKSNKFNIKLGYERKKRTKKNY